MSHPHELQLVEGTAILDVNDDSFWLHDATQRRDYKFPLSDARNKIAIRDRIVAVFARSDNLIHLKNLTSGKEFSTIEWDPMDLSDPITLGARTFWACPVLWKVALLTPWVNVTAGGYLAVAAFFRCNTRQEFWTEFGAGFAAFSALCILSVITGSNWNVATLDGIASLIFLYLAPLAGSIVYFGQVKQHHVESAIALQQAARDLIRRHHSQSAPVEV